MTAPYLTHPLVWLLILDFVVGAVWGVLKYFAPEFQIHPTMERLCIGLVVLINIVVILFWLISMLGYAVGTPRWR